MRIDPEEPRQPKFRPKLYRGPKPEFYRKKDQEAAEETAPAPAEVVTRPVRKHRKEVVKYVKKEAKKSSDEASPKLAPEMREHASEEQKEESAVAGATEFYKEEAAGYESRYYNNNRRGPRRGNRRGRGYRFRKQWDRRNNYEEDRYYNNSNHASEQSAATIEPAAAAESFKKPWTEAHAFIPQMKEVTQSYEEQVPAVESSPTGSPKQPGKLNVDAPPFRRTSSKNSPIAGSEPVAAPEFATAPPAKGEGLSTAAKAFVPKPKLVAAPVQPQSAATAPAAYMPYAPGIYQNVVLIPPQPMILPMSYGGNFYVAQPGLQQPATGAMPTGFYAAGYGQQPQM